jgi:hypothetical protein
MRRFCACGRRCGSRATERVFASCARPRARMRAKTPGHLAAPVLQRACLRGRRVSGIRMPASAMAPRPPVSSHPSNNGTYFSLDKFHGAAKGWVAVVTLGALHLMAGPAGFPREVMPRRNIAVLRFRAEGHCSESGSEHLVGLTCCMSRRIVERRQSKCRLAGAHFVAGTWKVPSTSRISSSLSRLTSIRELGPAALRTLADGFDALSTAVPPTGHRPIQ